MANAEAPFSRTHFRRRYFSPGYCGDLQLACSPLSDCLVLVDSKSASVHAASGVNELVSDSPGHSWQKMLMRVGGWVDPGRGNTVLPPHRHSFPSFIEKLTY